MKFAVVTSLVFVLVLALGAGIAHAQEQLRVDLDMNSLPTDQGWIFGNTTDDQNDYYHVDGSALYLNSTNLGWGMDTGAYYYHRLAMYVGVPNWSLTVRARVHESFPTEGSNPWGFGFLLSLDGYMSGFALTPGEIRLAGEVESRPHSGSQWHTYTMLASLRTGLFSFYIDGELFDTLPLSPNFTNEVRIGDHTNSGWSTGEISHLTFVLSNSTVVPNDSETWGGVKALYR